MIRVPLHIFVLCALICVPAVASAQSAASGADLYATSCQSCHGALTTTNKRGATLERTQSAINSNIGSMGVLSNLTAAEQEAIAAALANPAAAPADAGARSTLDPAPSPSPSPAPVPKGDFVILAWDDLGMNMQSKNFSEMSLLPPGNTLMAQVIKKGAPPAVVTEGVGLSYSIDNNASVVGKTNFWTYASQLFDKSVATGVGLTGNGLAGKFEVAGSAFAATGVPVLPLNDPMTWDPYQHATVKLVNSQVSAPVVTPASDEINCSNCHSSGSVAAQGIDTPSVEGNILTLHDKQHGTSLMNSRPISCSQCHSDNLVGSQGVPSAPSLSLAMHVKHASMNPQPGCYECHPGVKTQSARSAMTGMSECTKCHGNLETMAKDLNNGRKPWLDQPSCTQCHTSDANTGGSLYRKSIGHGGVACAACHNSPHAWTPSVRTDDNAQVAALQDSNRPLGKCSVCHTDNRIGAKPPHNRIGLIADGIAASSPQPSPTANPSPATAVNCSQCHGDNRSGPLPRNHPQIPGDKTTTSSGGDTAINCNQCHSGRSGPLPNDHPSINGSGGGDDDDGDDDEEDDDGDDDRARMGGDGGTTGGTSTAVNCNQCHSGRSGALPKDHPRISGQTTSTRGGGTTTTGGGGTAATSCSQCHGDGRSGALPRNHPSIGGGTTTTATGGTTSSGGGAAINCNQCHSGRSGALPRNHPNIDGSTTGGTTTTAINCNECHSGRSGPLPNDHPSINGSGGGDDDDDEEDDD